MPHRNTLNWRKSSHSGDTNCVEVAFAPHRNNLNWRKSSHSGEQTACVEVAFVPQRVAVRDSKNTAGPTLAFAAPTWHAFLATAR